MPSETSGWGASNINTFEATWDPIIFVIFTRTKSTETLEGAFTGIMVSGNSFI